MTNRRMFLQTAGAALAVPAIGGGVALSQRPAGDAVVAEVLRQARAAAEAATRAGSLPGGEPLRQLANALRTLAAHGPAIALDETIRNGLRERIAQEGRQSVLAQRADIRAVAATLKREGIDIDISRLAPVPDDPAARSAAIDAVLKAGATPGLRSAADALDKLAAAADRQRGGIQHARAQYYIGECEPYYWQLLMLETIMITTCLWSVLVPELCAIAAASYLLMRYALMFNGC